MKKLLNQIVIFFLQEIIKPFSDSQIRMLQDWLIALSNALFALRSEAQSKPLSDAEREARTRFDSIDKDVHLYGSASQSSFYASVKAGIRVPTDPNARHFKRTLVFRSPLNAEERERFSFKKTAMSEVTESEGSTSYSGIWIINYFDKSK